MLAALGTKPATSELEEARTYAGALLLFDAMIELRNIRKLIAAALKADG